jgi:hypothetical protein
MKTVTVTIILKLHDDSKTDWIEQSIEEQLEAGEVIIDGNITEVFNDKRI